jgi:anaerobic magnesium-protoporphyrin IX monomethyl ester cyclase
MIKFFLIRPPSYYPAFFLSSQNAFLPPLELACLASYVKEKFPYMKIKILDCPGEKISWKSLESIIKKEQPQIIGTGGYLHNYHESVRLFKLAKSINPLTITIAGGHFFSWLPKFSLSKFSFIDYIVRFEGEEVLFNLLKSILEKEDVSKVKGVAFRKGKNICITPLAPLIEDLNSLPFPAFELLPLDKYTTSFLWSNAIPLDVGRGCCFGCKDCSLTRFWGKALSDKEEDHLPFLRLKSPERVLEEIDFLYYKYERRFFFFTAPTFNADQKWLYNFFTKFLRRNYKNVKFFAYLKAELVVRDKNNGIVEMMCKAGLTYPLLGVSFKNLDIASEAFRILKKYKVVPVGNFLNYWGYTSKKLREMLFYIIKNNSPIRPTFFIPFPGSSLYKKYFLEGLICEDDYYSKGYFFSNAWNKISSKLSFSFKEKIYYGFALWIYFFKFFLYNFDKIKHKGFKEIVWYFLRVSGLIGISFVVLLFEKVYEKLVGKKIGLSEYFARPFWYEG